MISLFKRLWLGPFTKPVLIDIAPGTTIDDLADLVQVGTLPLHQIDPRCRGEVEELLISRHLYEVQS